MRELVAYFITEVAYPCVVTGLPKLLHPFCVPDCLFCATIPHTVVMTQPSQSAFSEQRVHTGRLAQYMESALDMLSCHDLPRIRRMVLRWFVWLLSSLFYPVWHISLSYSSVLTLHTAIFCLHASTARGLPTLESLEMILLR